ncbi:MAG: phosphoribosyl-ATP diphosphatase [Alphaproteobacteria bacterium]|nr:phosphoribosyl-ATP diphosphatase [Alphaproteobacteria bacterium]
MSAFLYLDTLIATIQSRVGGDPKLSHTAKLLKRGPARIAKKVGEEGVEVAIAAAQGHREEVVAESADLLFHLMVLWQSMGVIPAEVMAELARREAQSGIAEKAARVAE